jgi:hypothetical protein
MLKLSLKKAKVKLLSRRTTPNSKEQVLMENVKQLNQLICQKMTRLFKEMK